MQFWKNNLITVLASWTIVSVAFIPDSHHACGSLSHHMQTRALAVISRHGDRSPTVTFPTDLHPTTDRSEWPTGSGMLTLHGRQRMQRLGHFVRISYSHFDWSSASVRGIACREERCTESGQWFLEGLGIEQRIEFEIDDQMLSNFPSECRAYRLMNHTIMTSPYFKKFSEVNSRKLDYALEKAGAHERDLNYALLIGAVLMDEEAAGKVLPTWATENNVMSVLRNLTELNFCSMAGSRVMQKLMTGLLFKDLSNEFSQVISSSGRKPRLMLYETHDNQVASILRLFGVFDKGLPPYGATIIFELNQDRASGGYSIHASYLWEDESFHQMNFERPSAANFFDSISGIMIHEYEKECNEEEARFTDADSISQCWQ